jgi:trans-aconitate methyltransferase
MQQTPAYDVANTDLVPDGARRVVDIGCRLGSLAWFIRERPPATRVVRVGDALAWRTS